MSKHRPLLATHIMIPITAVQPVAVTGETVAIPAGAAGAVVDAYVLKKPILKNTHDYVGGFGNSSLVLTSSTFTTEVSPKEDADLANGEYWVDYITGRIHGRKADTATSLSASYYIFSLVGSGSGGGGTITFHDNQVFTSVDWVAAAGVTTIPLGYTPDAGSLHVFIGPGRVLPIASDPTYGFSVSGSNLVFNYELDPSSVVLVDGRVTTP